MLKWKQDKEGFLYLNFYASRYLSTCVGFLIVATIYYVDTYLSYIGCMFTVHQGNHRRYVARVPSDVEAVGYH